MVEDVFNIGFFYNKNGCQSAILDLISKQNGVRMFAIIPYLSAKFEQHREMHVQDMVEDMFNTVFFLITKMAASQPSWI